MMATMTMNDISLSIRCNKVIIHRNNTDFYLKSTVLYTYLHGSRPGCLNLVFVVIKKKT